jgi:hypothetical protein
MKHVILVPIAVFAAGLLLGCGSSNGPRRLSIQLVPSAPTLTINSYTIIDTQTTPELPKYYGSLTWSVQGYTSTCTELSLDPQNAPPMPNCPNGWIAQEQPMVYGVVTNAYYFSPPTAGTYTVLVQGQIQDPSSNQKIDYQGSASAVVTVTAK